MFDYLHTDLIQKSHYYDFFWSSLYRHLGVQDPRGKHTDNNPGSLTDLPAKEKAQAEVSFDKLLSGDNLSDKALSESNKASVARLNAIHQVGQRVRALLKGRYLIVTLNAYRDTGSRGWVPVEIAAMDYRGEHKANYLVEPDNPFAIPPAFASQTGLNADCLRGHLRLEDIQYPLEALLTAKEYDVVIAENANSLTACLSDIPLWTGRRFADIAPVCFTHLTDPCFDTATIARVCQTLALVNALILQGIVFFDPEHQSTATEGSTLKRCINRCSAIAQVLSALSQQADDNANEATNEAKNETAEK